jgi:AcrR family transcriptional regulator
MGAEPALHRALIELCHEGGYRGVTIDRLCERAGVDRDAFEAGYEGLDDCFGATLEECADEFLARMTATYEQAEGRWQDRLRAAAHTALLHLREDPVRAHFTVVESVHGGERAQLALERVFATLARFLDDGRKLPGAPASLSEVTAQSLHGGMVRQMRIGFRWIETDRFAAALPQMMYAVVLPYVGPKAAAEELEIPPCPQEGMVRPRLEPTLVRSPVAITGCRRSRWRSPSASAFWPPSPNSPPSVATGRPRSPR